MKQGAGNLLRTANYELPTGDVQQRHCTFSEPVLKVAEPDEGRGVDGAQELSVYNILDAPSTGATPQFAASVEFRKKSNASSDFRDHVKASDK